MRKLEREPLSEIAARHLFDRTDQIRACAVGLTTSAEQFQAQKEEAKRLWLQDRTAAHAEIKDCLKRMAPGDGQCMYCEIGEGSSIDHFYPQAKYPDRTYCWHNYLWACSVCNSKYKRDQFPLDDTGQPLLINPVEEDPRDHLELSPKTGKYVGRTPKGKESISVLGLGRRALELARHRAWISVESHIEAYAQRRAVDENSAADDIKCVLCRFPHASIFDALIRTLDTDGAQLVIGKACVAAIEAYPEIRTWTSQSSSSSGGG